MTTKAAETAANPGDTSLSVGTATPRGIGVYTSRLVRQWDDRRAAKEIAEYREMRCRHVALCSEAADGWRADHGVLADVADHLRGAGIDTWVYALPSAESWRHPDALADRLADAGVACGARGWIPDVEEQARGLRGHVRRFRSRLTERASERYSIGVTYYGRIPVAPSAGDAFPWDAIVGWGWAGYQLYETAVDRQRVRARLAQAREHWGRDVIPHLATYQRRDGGDGADRLRADIERTCLDDAGAVDVPGLWLWQDSTTDAAERAVLAAFAQRAGW